MSVDVRLCGSIPRKDIIQTGAPCSFEDYLTSRDSSSLSIASAFAKTHNGQSSTLHKTMLYDALEGILTHNKMKDTSSTVAAEQQQQRGPLCQLVEPPAWACAAKGETRLEVRYNGTDSHLFPVKASLKPSHLLVVVT